MSKCNWILVFLTLLTVSEYPYKAQAFREFDVNGVDTILALENEKINIDCKTDIPMAYCGFRHPSGKRYSFSGRALNNGYCAIKIQATKNDTGLWRCHIGTKETGVELVKYKQVRVVTQLAAVQKNVSAVYGKRMSLVCITTRGLTPLSYCRFEPPHGQPFNIDSDVTASNPILGRYYFPTNKSLDRGDCAVTIHKVKYEDVGSWTCGAGLDDGQEHIDSIQFEVEGFYTMSTASATGVTFGAIGIAIVLAVLGYVAWKKRSILGALRPEAEPAEVHEMAHLPASRSLQRTPQPSRSIPLLTKQSPSEPSESPLIPAAQP